MDRLQKAAGGVSCAESLLSMMIAALLRVGADESVVELVAKSIIRDRPISAQSDMQKYANEEAKIFIERERLSNRLMREEVNLEKGIARYIRTFGKEPYFGLPIGEMSLSDLIKEVQRQIQVLNDAFSSGRPIPEEPMQNMGAGLPPPIFCTGLNHCSIASMLSLISYICMLLGYTGNAPPRSFSICLGNLFKDFLHVKRERCIVIEGIFTNLNVFLQLLRENYPPYATFLDRIFTLFSSKTFSKNTNGTCSPHEGSKEVPSYLKMLEESKESLGNRLQLALLSCGSEQVHSHLQMKPGAISAFGLPCESLNIDITTGEVLGRIPQIPLTVESIASFQLFGRTVGSGLQFEIDANLFAAICDTRGRNQNFGAEDAQHVGTSHYYLVICAGDRYFFVDSSRTNVQEISQEGFLQNVNDNGIVIFMRNRVEQEVPQQVAKIDSQSPLLQTPSAGGGAVSRPQPPLKPSTDRAAVSRPQPPLKPSARGGAVSRPQPPQKPSARGGEAAVSHKPSGSFGHSPQFTSASKSQSWMERLQDIFQNLFIEHLIHTAVKSSGKYEPSPHDVANDLSFLSSIAFDVNNLPLVNSDAFIYANSNVTLTDFTTKHNVVSSFRVRFLDGDTMVRVTAVVFEDGHVIACPEIKDLQKEDPRREQLRNEFYQAIYSYFQRFPKLVIVKVLVEPIKLHA
jgi:hypothetical protein